jgi:hypothetical protein
MTKKVTDAFALGGMMKQVKTIEEVQIPALLAQARALLDGDADADTELLRAREDRREARATIELAEAEADELRELRKEISVLRRRGGGGGGGGEGGAGVN